MVKISSLTWNWVKTHLLLSLTVMAISFVGYQAIVLVNIENKLVSSILLPLFIFFTVLVSGFFFGYSTIKSHQLRLEDLAAFIAVLGRGNFKARLKNEVNDEIGKCTNELNDLAEKVESNVQSLQRLASENAALAQQAHQAATEDERQRLARELHDAVSQQLFALNMMSSACVRVIDQNVNLAKTQMIEIAEMAANAQAEMRALLLHLRPTHLTNDPLHIAINNLLSELKGKCNVQFTATIEEVHIKSQGVENHVFRIVQEALSNVLRHADATEVKINLSEQDNKLRLQIGDNGKGFNVKSEKIISYGLQTMKERCEEVGGTLTIQSKEGEGTYLLMKIPLNPEGDYNGQN